MCGIVGIRRFDGRRVDEGVLRAMAAQLEHRGPDGDGFAIFAGGDVGFGHTRLSIIGLRNGSQPMTSPDGAVHVVVNGEFYTILPGLGAAIPAAEAVAGEDAPPD